MEYSVTSLTTVADCDAVLGLIEKEKSDLDFQKISLERQQKKYAETTVELTTELAMVETELAAINAIVATLPEGPIKADNIKKQKKLEYSLFLLNNRKASYGAITLLEKEFSLARILKEQEEADAFAAAVTARKAAI